MHIMRNISPFLFSIVVLFGLSFFGYNLSTEYTPETHTYVVENIPHRQDPLITHPNRNDNPAVWPQAYGLQWADWTSDTSLAGFASASSEQSSATIDTVREWFLALSACLFSILVCLMLLFISGVRSSWTRAY